MPPASPPANSGASDTKWSSRIATTCGLSAPQSAPGAAVTETKSPPKNTLVTSPVSKMAWASGRGLGLFGGGEFARAGWHHRAAGQELERRRVGRGFGFDEHARRCRDDGHARATRGCDIHCPFIAFADYVAPHDYSVARARRSCFIRPRRLAAGCGAGRPAALDGRRARRRPSRPRCRRRQYARAGRSVALSRHRHPGRSRNGSSARCPTGCAMRCAENGVPPGQVSIRVRIDAGSLYEKKGEAGLCPPDRAPDVPRIEVSRVRPGDPDLAAARGAASAATPTPRPRRPRRSTSSTCPMPSPTRCDESIKLLSGMIREPTLSSQDLAADVPIVLAEKRERSGARPARRRRQSRDLLRRAAAGRPRGRSAPSKTLQAATPASVRAFHERWYRPENTVIVVVGDADPQGPGLAGRAVFRRLEGQRRRSRSARFRRAAAPRKASIRATRSARPTVLVEPGLPRSLTYAYMRPWRPGDRQHRIQSRAADRRASAQAIINRRLEARARSGGSFLYAAVDQQDDQPLDRRRHSSPSRRSTPTGRRRWPMCARSSPMRSPSRRRRKRSTARWPSLDVAFANQVEQSTDPGRLRAGRRYRQGGRHPRERSPRRNCSLRSFATVAGPLHARRRCSQHTRDAVQRATVIRAFYLTPQAGEATDAELAAALARDAGRRRQRAACRQDAVVRRPAADRRAAAAGRDQADRRLEIEQLDFANGVKALMWNSGNEPGRVTVRVRFGGGWRAFTGDRRGLCPARRDGAGRLRRRRARAGRARPRQRPGARSASISASTTVVRLRGRRPGRPTSPTSSICSPRSWRIRGGTRARSSARRRRSSWPTTVTTSIPVGVLNRDLE